MMAAAAELKRRGNIEFGRGDYRHAAELFSRAIQLEPGNAVHLANRSLALLKLQRHSEALQDAETVVEMRPDWSKAFYRHGAALQALERYKEAISSFERALDLDSDNAKVKQALEDAKSALNKAEERAASAAKAKKRKEEAAAREAARRKSGAVKDSRLDSEELTGDLARPYHGWPVCVNQNDDRGRGVVAKRKLRPGEIAWQADAWCAVVSDNFIASVCATCFRIPNEEDGDMDIKCEGCGIAYYCSEKCKEESAALHKLECQCARQIVQVTQGKSDTRGARMMIRVLAQRQLEQQQGATVEEPNEIAADDMTSKPIWNGAKFEDVERLVSHLDTMPDEKIDQYRGIAKGVSKMPVSAGMPEEDVLQLVATLQCNSQGIVDLNHHRRGDLLIAPADINHSCAPNCFVAFHGKKVQFRTIKPIAEGEELTITYTDLYLPRDLRRQKLLTSHCFGCACDRCTDDSPNSVDMGLSGFACLSDGCDGLVPAASNSSCCLTCGARYDPQMLEGISMRSTQLYQEALKLYSERNFEGAGKKFADLIEQYGNSLYRRHTLLYNSFHHLMSASNAVGNAAAGASFARRAIACLEQVYPKYHSEVAMMHAALAQTEWRRFTDKPSDPGPQHASVSAFSRCLEILDVCYGKTHEAYVELSKLKHKVESGEMRTSQLPGEANASSS
jgi:tetratricopeptide (TPR) repeat protein